VVLSPEELLGSAYDPVRKYVRAPKKKERWPYCHAIWKPQPVDLVHLSVLKAPTPQVAIWLFNHLFAVDLFRTAEFREQLISWALEGIEWNEIL